MRPRRAALPRPSLVGLRIRKPGLPMPAAEWFEFSSFSPKRAAACSCRRHSTRGYRSKALHLSLSAEAPGEGAPSLRQRGPRARSWNLCCYKADSRARAKGQAMKIVDMSHVMNVHTPGWVGYAGNKMYYAQNLQTQMIVAQRIDTALHVGTHFDGAMHATDDPKGDMASLPLDYLVNRGVVVDISAKMSDWAVITPEIIESAGADIRDGDILLLHTGWHRHYEGRPQQDLVKYFCFHPGPNLDTLHWMLKKKIKWWGMDTGSCDHAMNTSIRAMRPDIAAQFTKLHGKTPAEFFGTFEYIHKRSGRRVVADVFPFHSWAFQEGLLHAENLGGDIEIMLNKRALIGAFPWRYQGLEACPCRIVAFLDAGDDVEAVGNAARALMSR